MKLLAFATHPRVPAAVAALALTSTVALWAEFFGEFEPNNTKEEAVPADCMVELDALGSSGNFGDPPEDIFLVRTCPQLRRIYRNRVDIDLSLQVVSPFGRLLGLGQTPAGIDVDDDVVAQLATVVGQQDVDEYVQWYGFGTGGAVYFDFHMGDMHREWSYGELRQQPVSPVQVPGTFDAQSMLTLTTFPTLQDTDLWVFDDELHALPGHGNDDAFSAHAGSLLERYFAPGTYYVAVAPANLLTHQPSPSDDLERSRPVFDRPGVVATSGWAANTTLDLQVTDGSNAQLVPYVTSEPLEVAWFELTVGATNAVRTVCAGDGQGTCPCGNEGDEGSRRGCANSTGLGALLLAVHSNSVTRDDLTVHAENLPPHQAALLFAADGLVNGVAGTPLGDGVLCIGGTTWRLGVRVADATGRAAWGPGLAAQYGFAAGSTLFFQAAYRDPLGSPCLALFNYTSALGITLAP
jgi:hypothetical protein